MAPVLSVRNLRKVYPAPHPFVAVDEISFDLLPGEILGLLGPNGSGKTTTIQMLLGTLSMTSGTITYFGKEFPLHRSEILQHVTFASTYTSLPYILTIDENLKAYGRLYGFKPKEIAERTEPLLERFGILDKKKARIASLSAGQITRLMIVKAFFTDPKIVLLDEPTASLDPDVAHEVLAFILERRKTTGLSILFTSHKMEEVSELCDRAIFLRKGNIIANDLPKNLAKSVSAFRLRLVIPDGMKRTIALVQKRNLKHTLEERVIFITLEESDIPSFLNELMRAEVTYSNISIEEPSLEDYFLHISKRNA